MQDHIHEYLELALNNVKGELETFDRAISVKESTKLKKNLYRVQNKEHASSETEA